MSSRKIIYKIKSTGQFAIQVGCGTKVTPTQIKENLVFEILNDDGERTGREVLVSPDDLEIVSPPLEKN